MQKPEAVSKTFLKDIIRPRLWLMNGTEVRSGAPLQVLYAGSETHKNYIAHLAFQGSYEGAFIGRRHVRTLRRVLQRNDLHASLIVIEGPYLLRRLHQRAGDFYVPLWLEGQADLPLVARTDGAEYELRRMRKTQPGFVVTQDPDQLRSFYHDMYLPYITQRHSDRTVVMDYSELMRVARRGACELLLVTKGGQPIAGVLILFGERLPRLWSAFLGGRLPMLWCYGIKGGDLSYWKGGAIGAATWFASVVLTERGYNRMDMGLSRAFLDDGVLRYKRKWGMRLVGHYRIGFLLRPRSFSPGLKGFLTQNPFVHVDAGRLSGAVFVEDAQPDPGHAFDKLAQDYYLPGLSRMDLYGFRDGGISLLQTFTSS